MVEDTRTFGYGRGIRLMLLGVMPASLLAGSFLILSDPEDSGTLFQTIANNALPLYVLSIIPGALISAMHTRLMGDMSGRDIPTYLRSAFLGVILGLALGSLLSLVLFRTPNSALWPIWAWGGSMGALYGSVRVHLGGDNPTQ
jgi:hypothetical protein